MENELTFETVYIKTDVTALKIIKNDFLLVGIGNTVSLYEISNKRFITNTKIFLGQKIHGLVPSKCENQIAVYGGKEIKTCIFDINNDIILTNQTHIQCDDWILTIIWIKNDIEFAVLTAHNVVQIWNIDSNTLQSSFKCDEKCILYSGLLKEYNNSILVFSGTVFSQVVLWNTNNHKVQHRLVGHKGVIFSISYDESNNIIVTTSDDRSVIIWSIERQDISDWSDIKISMKITLFGHTARVMRNEIVGNYIVSIGEDALMCTWDLAGNLLNKRRIHQDGCLWSLDCNLNKNIAVTGGGDSGVMIHRLISDLTHINSLDIPGTAKSIAITARNNIACLTECGKLIYSTNSDEWDTHNWDEMNPCSMFISICKQFIALIDINGFLVILAETCKFEAKLVPCINQRICDGRILSFNWLPDRKFCTCDKNGLITVWGSRGDQCIKLNEYYLPSCKERWLTVALTISDDAFLVGDRCGSIHLFNKQSVHPVQTLTKIHGRLGVNSIKLTDNKITTLGRDGTVKVFNIVNEDCLLEIQYLFCTKVPFNWVDRFIGKDGTVVCGFRETDLIVWDVEDNQHLTEFNCGGGHRSWDVIKKWNKINDTIVSYLQFTYIKNSTVNTIDIKVDDFSHSIVQGFHVKEINTLISLKHDNDFTFISAGEDTTLVFNRCCIDGINVDFKNQFKITKHLSSVRCLCVHKENERTIIFSAGGRAQICAWELISLNGNDAIFGCKDIGSHLVKGTDLERKGNVSWKNIQVDMDAETRFMSLSCLNIQPYGMILFSGCSDGYLRVYSVSDTFKLIGCYNFNSKCILKVHSIVFESHPIVFTCSTDGTLSIWDFNHINDDIKPVKSMKFHKAGINSFDVSCIGNDKFILATGGDDNDLQLNVVALSIVEEKLFVSEICKWSCDKYHCSQITGVKLLNDEYILSASIDQRVTIAQLVYDKTTLVDIGCKFVRQCHISVSDLQGMTVMNHERNEVLICLYGKGIEIMKINLPS